MDEIDDQRLFELLDRYVVALQAGDSGQCDRWLAEYPQLREMAQCLEALGRFSIPYPVAPGSSRPRGAAPSGESQSSAHGKDLDATIIRASGSFEETSDGETSALGEFGKYELL
ncbi:MAG TPA: hypothetical protein VGH74_23095, partial [Planctomycetaceae bacterium]